MKSESVIWSVILGILIGAIILALGCSTPSYPSFVATQIAAMPTVTATPLVSMGRFQIPNRYIDWQANVVCWYLEDAITCMPIKNTTLLGGQ